MKIGIVGSRSFNDYPKFKIIVSPFLRGDYILVSGGCYGVDKMAEKLAEEIGKDIVVFPVEWNKYGKRAGYIRNQKIVEGSDKVIALWDGVSPGTKITIDICKKMNKECIILNYNNF